MHWWGLMANWTARVRSLSNVIGRIRRRRVLLLLRLRLRLLRESLLDNWWNLSSRGIWELLCCRTVHRGVVSRSPKLLGVVVSGLWTMMHLLIRICYWRLLLKGWSGGGRTIARVRRLGRWIHLVCFVFEVNILLIARYPFSLTLRARTKVSLGINLWRSLGIARVAKLWLARSSIWSLRRV